MGRWISPFPPCVGRKKRRDLRALKVQPEELALAIAAGAAPEANVVDSAGAARLSQGPQEERKEAPVPRSTTE